MKRVEAKEGKMKGEMGKTQQQQKQHNTKIYLEQKRCKKITKTINRSPCALNFSNSARV